MGAQPWICAARSGRSTSPGATSSAPRTLAAWRVCAAHQAVRMQPRLCAASTTGPSASATVSSRRADQSPRSGRIQSCCSTRWSPWRASQRLCQWSGPEFCQPGSSRMVAGFITINLIAISAYPSGGSRHFGHGRGCSRHVFHALDHLLGKLDKRLAALGGRVEHHTGQTVAGGLGQAHVARDHGVEHL
eukprot:Opistho-1_new@7513